jgi:hypothetical protein
MDMKKLITTAFVLFTFLTTYARQSLLSKENKNLTYKIIPAAHQTCGYDIFNNNKLLIHQTCVPAYPGTDGFVTKEATEKVTKK